MAIYNKLTIGGSEVADNFNINVTKSQGDNDLSSNFSASIDNIDGRNSSNYNMGDNVIVYADQDVEIIPSAIPITHFKMNDNAASTVVADTGSDGNDGVATANTSTMTTTGKLSTALNFNGLPATVVNHYKCNDNAASTAVDDGGSAANDGVCDVNTDTITATGKINTCLKLRSTDAKFDLTSDIDLTTTKSICFWVKPRVISNGYVDANAYKNGYYPVAGHNVDTHDSCIDLRTNTIQIQDETGNAYTSSTTTTFAVGTWYHVAITFGATATTFYLDGVAHGTAAAFGAENLAIVSFGRAYSGITNAETDLDDIRVYNQVLGPNEVSKIYNSGTGTESQGDSVATTMSGESTTAPRSLACWFKLASDGWNYSVSQPLMNSKYLRIHVRSTDNQVAIRYDNAGARLSTYTIGTGDTDWHHAVGTFDGDKTTKIYVDGVLRDTDTHAVGPSTDYSAYNLGQQEHSIFDGDIDDVRIYDSALTLNEVGALYNHGVGTEVESSSNQKIFDGLLENIKFPSNVMDQKMTVTGRDYTARMMDRIVEPEIYTSLAAGSIVKDIIAKYADDITTTNVSDSATTISRIAFGNISVYDAVKQLAGLVETNYIFYVDDSKDLHFSEKSATSSGFTFDSGNTISADIREDRKNIYNEVWVYGDKYLDYFSESFTAGSPLGGSVFTLSYKPHSTEVTVDAAQQRGGIFGMNQVADSGTNYLVDFDSKKVVFVSGTTLGYDSIPASGAAVVTNYDRALSVIKVGQDSNSVASYGKRVKVVVDKAIKDPNAAQLRVERELSLLAEPEKEGNIKPKGFFNITPSETCVVNLPNQGVVSKTYDVLEVKYNFNKRDNITETNQSIKVNKKSKDFSDRVKDHELRIRKLEGADVLDADILPRFEFTAGSLSIRHSGLKVSTRSIAGDGLIWGNTVYGVFGTGKWRSVANIAFVLGNTQAGILGTNTLGTQASTYTVVWSGGYF